MLREAHQRNRFLGVASKHRPVACRTCDRRCHTILLLKEIDWDPLFLTCALVHLVVALHALAHFALRGHGQRVLATIFQDTPHDLRDFARFAQRPIRPENFPF